MSATFDPYALTLEDLDLDLPERTDDLLALFDAEDAPEAEMARDAFACQDMSNLMVAVLGATAGEGERFLEQLVNLAGPVEPVPGRPLSPEASIEHLKDESGWCGWRHGVIAGTLALAHAQFPDYESLMLLRKDPGAFAHAAISMVSGAAYVTGSLDLRRVYARTDHTMRNGFSKVYVVDILYLSRSKGVVRYKPFRAYRPFLTSRVDRWLEAGIAVAGPFFGLKPATYKVTTSARSLDVILSGEYRSLGIELHYEDNIVYFVTPRSRLSIGRVVALPEPVDVPSRPVRVGRAPIGRPEAYIEPPFVELDDTDHQPTMSEMPRGILVERDIPLSKSFLTEELGVEFTESLARKHEIFKWETQLLLEADCVYGAPAFTIRFDFDPVRNRHWARGPIVGGVAGLGLASAALFAPGITSDLLLLAGGLGLGATLGYVYSRWTTARLEQEEFSLHQTRTIDHMSRLLAQKDSLLAEHQRTNFELEQTRDALVARERLDAAIESNRMSAHNWKHELATMLLDSMRIEHLVRGLDREGKIRPVLETLRRRIGRQVDSIEWCLAIDPERPLSLKSIDLWEIAEESIERACRDAEVRQIEIEAVSDAGDTVVEADARAVAGVLDNLIGNAIEAIDERLSADPSFESILRVRLTRQDGVVKLSVEDNGVEVRDEESLFRLFYSTKGDGAGIGLAGSRAIIERHGGTLEYDRGDEGSGLKTFAMTLPTERPIPHE